MLAGAFPSARVTGVDSSEAFVAQATAAVAQCRFVVADATVAPLPSTPADVIYARFLLVHLVDPAAVVEAWSGQLRPGGMLVVEEPERIDTADADFRRYLELATAVVGARGGDLYAGRTVAAMAAPPGTTTVVQRQASLDVPAGKAATIFSLNLATWAADRAVLAVARPDEVAALGARLEERRGDPSTGVIEWGMRQLVVQAR